jgi:hypothetical protein
MTTKTKTLVGGTLLLSTVIVANLLPAAVRPQPARTAAQVKDQADEAVAMAMAQAAAEAKTEAACRTNLQCWGDKHAGDAAGPCKRAVQQLAKFDYEWTDGWTTSKFPRWGWANKKAGTLRYAGDAVKFQNGFGALLPHRYLCDWNPTTKEVLAVRASPGRWER